MLKPRSVLYREAPAGIILIRLGWVLAIKCLQLILTTTLSTLRFMGLLIFKFFNYRLKRI